MNAVNLKIFVKQILSLIFIPTYAMHSIFGIYEIAWFMGTSRIITPPPQGFEQGPNSDTFQRGGQGWSLHVLVVAMSGCGLSMHRTGVAIR